MTAYACQAGICYLGAAINALRGERGCSSCELKGYAAGASVAYNCIAFSSELMAMLVRLAGEFAQIGWRKVVEAIRDA